MGIALKEEYYLYMIEPKGMELRLRGFPSL